MAEQTPTMYSVVEGNLRVVPVTLSVITTSMEHASGIRDGMQHTIRMLSEYYDIVMRMSPYIEEGDEGKWVARTRFAIVPTSMPRGMKPRWIEIKSALFEEKVVQL